MEQAKAKVDFGFDIMEKLGIEYYCFHDVDIDILYENNMWILMTIGFFIVNIHFDKKRWKINSLLVVLVIVQSSSATQKTYNPYNNP